MFGIARSCHFSLRRRRTAILQIAIIGLATGAAASAQEPVACELVDARSAEKVLGGGATNPGGVATKGACRYDNAEANLVMMVQILPAQMYDVIPINPQTAVDIGDRGRYGVGTSGSANVQFVKGAFSVTIRVTPMPGPPATALVEPLLEIARTAADRMPG